MDIVDLRRLKSPDQYSRTVRTLMLPLLVPLSGLYGAAVGLWRMIPPRPVDVGVPVVSIGSLTVGGTGKTPVCMKIAERFRDLGRRACVLSRGYRRRSAVEPLVVSDGRDILASVEEAGDEPYMMARRLEGVAVVVGKNRVAAALEARDALGADLLVLDDGFQARKLSRQADVLCFDHGSLERGGALLPWGTLRERWSVIRPEHLAVVLLGDPASRPSGRELACLGKAPVFYAARSEPAVLDPGYEPMAGKIPAGRRFAAVSGIARPEAFERSCLGSGASVPVSIRFADHHWYSDDDTAAIAALMKKHGCSGILTTEKDMWKLPGALREICLILAAQLDLLESEAFWETLDSKLGADSCPPKSRTSLS